MHNIDHPALKHKAQKPLTQIIRPPDDFDPSRFPILASHWPDLVPAPINAASAALAVDPPFRRQVELLSTKGPRLPVELLAEIAIEYGLEEAVRKKIARYLSIPDAALDVTGARQLPPLPIHAVHGGKP